MKKQALRRFLLGLGYVALVILLLLYQLGMFKTAANPGIAVLGTFILGCALAVVLVLYIRVTDQIRRQPSETPEGVHKNSWETLSYEEVYALFLEKMKDYSLSERELEVAWLLLRGYTNRQIGEELYIAETTVKKHVSHIYQKMQVYSRKEFREKVQAGGING